MQLNVWGLLGVGLAISSLFLPWVSGSYNEITVYLRGHHCFQRSFNVAPLQGRFTYEFLVNGSIETTQSIPLGLFFVAWGDGGSLSLAIILLCYFAICLETVGAFSFGDWTENRRKICVVGALFWLSGFALVCQGMSLVPRNQYGDLGSFTLGNVFTVDSDPNIYEAHYQHNTLNLNVGLLMAVLSILALFASVLSPKLLSIRMESKTGKFGRLRCVLLIPEKGRIFSYVFFGVLIAVFFLMPLILPAIMIGQMTPFVFSFYVIPVVFGIFYPHVIRKGMLEAYLLFCSYLIFVWVILYHPFSILPSNIYLIAYLINIFIFVGALACSWTSIHLINRKKTGIICSAVREVPH